MILLHPTPVHHAFWQPVAGHLASRYRLITPDFRGHGQSQPGEGTISIERLGEDIVRLLDTLNIQRALFVGCSIGGYTLYELWRRIPERIQALAFCCSKPQPDSPENKAKRQQNIEQIRVQGAESFFESMANTLVGQTTQRRDPGKVSAAREMMRAMRPEAVMAVQQGLADRPGFCSHGAEHHRSHLRDRRRGRPKQHARRDEGPRGKHSQQRLQFRIPPHHRRRALCAMGAARRSCWHFAAILRVGSGSGLDFVSCRH